MTAVLAALAAAVCFAVASCAQHHAASTTAAGGGWRLVVRMVSRPLWLLGVVAGLVGFGAQALALASGALMVVQLVLVSGLAIALPVSVVVERRRPRPAEWLWAALTVAALVLFLLAGRPSPGQQVAGGATLALVCAVCAAVAAATAVAARRLDRRFRALALGLAGGIAFGIAGALAKQVVDMLDTLGVGVLLTWSAWALAAAALAGVVATQASYRAGVLAAAQPAITIGEPLTAAVIGALAFGEHLAPDPLALTGEVVAAVLMLASVVGLAHATAVAERATGRPETAPLTPPPPSTPDRDRVAASAQE